MNRTPFLLALLLSAACGSRIIGALPDSVGRNSPSDEAGTTSTGAGSNLGAGGASVGVGGTNSEWASSAGAAGAIESAGGASAGAAGAIESAGGASAGAGGASAAGGGNLPPTSTAGTHSIGTTVEIAPHGEAEGGEGGEGEGGALSHG